MQSLINEYFSKLCSDKFFINDGENIIGRTKDIIEELEQESKYVSNPNNKISKEEVEFITNEAKDLINEIKKEYSNEDDVIKISLHPMVGFYTLIDKESLCEELKEYYDELEE